MKDRRKSNYIPSIALGAILIFMGVALVTLYEKHVDDHATVIVLTRKDAENRRLLAEKQLEIDAKDQQISYLVHRYDTKSKKVGK